MSDDTSKTPQPKSPAITSANLPPAPTATQPANTSQAPAVAANVPIVGKPLVDADFTKLKPKNKNIAFFWGNRIANGGLRIEDLKARGFEIATKEDVDAPQALQKNGMIMRGDLVLLKIDKVMYESALKHNQERADARVSKQAVTAKGREEVAGALREVGGLPARYRGKIGVYSPNVGEFDNR